MLKSFVASNDQLKGRLLSEDLNHLFEKLNEEGVQDDDIRVQFHVAASDKIETVFELALVIWKEKARGENL